ncbi:MAG TPA: rRNA maturation RNase YbeY [Chlamydiales bacterium]|nr:rRNA maturation RNase YbeY [Chlamydiales bacterium]
MSRTSIKSVLMALVDYLKINCDELSLFLVSKNRISSLHKQFFGDPTPTDCISLPLDENYLGDLFVCPAVAIDYAKKKGLDPYEETLLYIIHSLLHLRGYDDLDPKKRRVMRKKEKRCMNHLRSVQIRLHS